MNEEEIPPVEAEGEVLQEQYKFVASGCQWRQRGSFIVCVSCELQHAHHVGMQVLLTGMDEEGKPVLVDREEYFKQYEKKK